jgi:hypothetical protein
MSAWLHRHLELDSDADPDRPWTPEEIGVLARAVSRAPSVRRTQPWELEVRGRSASLYEIPGLGLHRRDPTGRHRVISCGAVLANLVLAVRSLGWSATVELGPDPAQPDRLATVTGRRRQEPGTVELAEYEAITRRRSYRQRFSSLPLVGDDVADLVTAAATHGVTVRRFTGPVEAAALAGALSHIADMLHGDSGCQRELQAWVGQGDGFPVPGATHQSIPMSQRCRLAARIAGECVLVLLTPNDARRDHLLAGVGMQHAWLTATHIGLVASAITRPLQVGEVRSGLIERLGLPGVPQALLRVGRPKGAVPPVPRRPLAGILPTEHDEERE